MCINAGSVPHDRNMNQLPRQGLSQNHPYQAPHTQSGVAWIYAIMISLVVQTVAPWQPFAANQAIARTEGSSHPPASSPHRPTAPSVAGPIVSADADLGAARAISWMNGSVRMILLERRVTIKIGSYGFRAKRAVVRIETQILPGNRMVRHLALFLDTAEPLQNAGIVQAQSRRLLVTVSTTGHLRLATDLLKEPKTAIQDPFVDQAQQRFARHLAALSSKPLDVPAGDKLFDKDTQTLPYNRRQTIARESLLKSTESLLAHSRAQDPHAVAPLPPRPSRPIMAPGGTLMFHAEKIIFQDGVTPHDESTLSLLGNVRVIYQNSDRKQTMSLRAQNAVIFLAQGAMNRLSARQANAEDITGVYLEDNVTATDGQYTIRAPRVFYDLVRNKAVVLDAVYYAWDVSHNLPIYVRAQKLRQESMTHWSANHATLTTSEFAEPHFSIASNRLEFRRQANPNGSPGYRFVARDSTLRWGKLPIFYWPYLAGNAQSLDHSVLPRVSASYSDQDGPILRTTWNLFAVAGQPQPEGVKLRGRLDYLGDRGPAAGLNLDYTLPQMFGSFDSYLIVDDQGDDELGDNRKLELDGDTRGYALWRHRQYLRNGWELSLELSHVSDETFLEEYFRNEAEISKPYETSIYLKKQEKDRALTFVAQQHTMSFTPQLTTLQAPGYTVEKTPQLGYYRRGVSLWGDRLTYSSETTLGRMRIIAGKDSPSDRGFDTLQSMQLFGIAPTTTFEASTRSAGIPSNYRLRLDSRHEIQSPLKMGIFDLVPYASGRVTLYDDDFEEFSGDDDRIRGRGTLGLRIHTQFSKTYQGVESRVLDLYRLRHVIEPRADLFWSGSTIDPDDLPVYDNDVEGLQEGWGGRIGMRHILQTQRGGPGQWRSVDWLVLGMDLVLHNDHKDVDANVARFFSYRPELSVGGDHFHTDMMWMVSDVLATVGDLIYSLEHRVVSQWRLGVSLQQTPRLSFFTDYSEIDELSSRLLTYGFNYKLTPKYNIGYQHTLDLGDNESRNISLTLERKLPRWRLQVVAQIDDLEDETTIGMILIPEGLRSSRLVPFANR